MRRLAAQVIPTCAVTVSMQQRFRPDKAYPDAYKVCWGGQRGKEHAVINSSCLFNTRTSVLMGHAEKSA